MDIIDKLPTIKKLIRQLQQVPFLASKNMYKVLAHFLKLDQRKTEQLCAVLKEVKQEVVLCQHCFSWKERAQQCLLCDDSNRDASLICVVETWQDLLVVERTENYRGLYHVLGGVICPLDGIGPNDLTIDSLLHRAATKSVKEVILAMNYTPEGEATAAFIARRLEDKGVLISSLAKGVPIGSNLEFVDRLTIGKAISDRKPF